MSNITISRFFVQPGTEYVYFGRWAVRAGLLYAIVLGCWLLYFAALISAPVTSSSQLQIDPQTLYLLRFTVAIPYLVIWLSACYAFIRLNRYAQAIQPSPEAPAFQVIAKGVFILLISLIMSTFLSSIRSALSQTDWRPLLTILTNYAYVIPYLFAFICFYLGANQLAKQASVASPSYRTYILWAIPFVIFVYFWLESIFSNDTRSVADATAGATYYLRDSLLILTIVVPSLVTWMLGLMALIKLRAVYHQVAGVIYQNALFSLVIGIALVIFGSILLQAVLSLGSQRIFYLGIAAILAIVYVFLIIQTVGFLLVSRGAHKLTKIEAV